MSAHNGADRLASRHWRDTYTQNRTGSGFLAHTAYCTLGQELDRPRQPTKDKQYTKSATQLPSCFIFSTPTQSAFVANAV